MSVKSKHSSSKTDKIGKKEKRKKIEDSDEDIESSEEELDLTKECHPIGHYMNDRAEMINQMFSVIKGNKLKAMLPPILKDCDLEQLKLQCLDQLLGMSEKRITCILEGETLETSSESEVEESDEYDSDEKNRSSSGSSSEGSEESQDGNYTNNVNRKHRKRKGDFVNEGKAGKLPKTETNGPPEQGKTLLEILELEMRARAIRALLKQSGNEKGNEQGTEEAPSAEETQNGVEETTDEVVDLTKGEDEEFPVCVKKETSEETEIDKKVSNFEEKIEKSKTEKNTTQEDEKSKRLQAELELRNKLFKKKIYRTRQQRMENEEEDKSAEKTETQSVSVSEVSIKQEPVEPEEVVVEDPEEGEISTSEDEYPVEIKQEPIPEPEPEPEPEPQLQEETNDAEDFERKMGDDAERVTAIDNGTFVNNCNLEIRTQTDMPEVEGKTEESTLEDQEKVEVSQEEEEEVQNNVQNKEKEPENIEGGTSWRDRWLQKDGVQKLVKSSKIYAKVKKRIAEKSQKAKEEVPTPYEANSDSNSNSRLEVVEGSIEEYERLLGKQPKSDLNENSQQSCFSEVGTEEGKQDTTTTSTAEATEGFQCNTTDLK